MEPGDTCGELESWCPLVVSEKRPFLVLFPRLARAVGVVKKGSQGPLGGNISKHRSSASCVPGLTLSETVLI